MPGVSGCDGERDSRVQSKFQSLNPFSPAKQVWMPGGKGVLTQLSHLKCTRTGSSFTTETPPVPSLAYRPGLWTSAGPLTPSPGLAPTHLKVQFWLPVSGWYVGASAPFPAAGSAAARFLNQPSATNFSFPFLFLLSSLSRILAQLCAPRTFGISGALFQRRVSRPDSGRPGARRPVYTWATLRGSLPVASHPHRLPR